MLIYFSWIILIIIKKIIMKILHIKILYLLLVISMVYIPFLRSCEVFLE